MVINEKKPWYISGLHFECKQCGKCCSGPQEGVIWITRPEINLLANYLGLSAQELCKKHLRRIGFRYSIQEKTCSKDCVFLTKSGGSKYCAIYDLRPLQCRAWPFWPGNLQTPYDWNVAASKCLGINKGKFYSFEEIEKIKKQKQWWKNSTSCLAAAGTAASLTCDEVKQIYDWLDSEIKQFDNQCVACGKCCNFESFGHKLFITSPELLYFQNNVNHSRKMTGKVCPYHENGKCTVRNFRFAGCRIFFCKADKNLQNRLSENTIEKFKRLCDKYDIPYYYKDLAAVLNNPL